MNDVKSLRQLRGAEKVAALLLAIDKSVAGSILKRFGTNDLREITAAASSLGRISAPQFHLLVEEFASHFSTDTDLLGSPTDAERLLESALPPEAVSDMMADLNGDPSRNIWQQINALPEALVASHLEKEHPQVAAYVLSKASASFAAKVLATLPSEARNEATQRLIAMRSPAESVVRFLEKSLHTDLVSGAAKSPSVNPHARLAGIINKLDRAQSDEILRNIEAKDTAAAASIRSLMFSFEDIVKLSQRSRATLFDNVSPESMILSLKGAPPQLCEIFLSALGGRVRRMVESELQNGLPTPAKEIEAARRAIADIALNLYERGLIELVPESDQA
jgi:flagellar motor switch protein FliG